MKDYGLQMVNKPKHHLSKNKLVQNSVFGRMDYSVFPFLITILKVLDLVY
jgi:hypothetical protein